MEPVSEESVEQYCDFFLRLSPEQLKEKIAEFRKKQPYVFKSIVNCANDIGRPDPISLLWRMTLLFTYCFESYDAKLYMVPEKAIGQYQKEFHRKVKTWKPETLDDTLVKAALREINQQFFFDYIESVMAHLDHDQNLVTRDESTKIYNTMMIIGQLYIRSIQRY